MSEIVDPIDPAAHGQVEFTRWLAQLRTDMAESVSGTLLRGARAVPVDGNRNRPTYSPGALIGLSFRSLERVGEAFVYVRDHENNLIAQGQITDPGTMEPMAFVQWFGPGGINIPDGGLFVSADADFEGVVYIRGAD
ncbi:hypothetical protein F9L07_19885 [Pimelobacter simplex]|uniref:Uncharacterized protein n=1 Tax=Nocardioides simplex TaxID=2045 RepID=A0A7J5DVF9_NOCSI|nr:hypothetical protein [Pimelobacter simplex]KAB2809303.1 hypothetical protein F9L07_19885 [Pimelobacter simplex]